MNLLRLLPRAAAAAFAFTLSAQASAYCQTYTCDPNKDCEYDTEKGCWFGGKTLYWSHTDVSFDVQKDGSKLQGISADQLEEVVINAFLQWQNATCDEDGTPPAISLLNFGKVSCGKPEYNKTQPNQNVITFHDAKWPYKNSGAETLALTTVFFAPDTGEIYDANIELNSWDPNIHFTLGPDASDPHGVDLNSVLTHEAGHFLGLSHSNVSAATMAPSYSSGMATLEADDMEGICASLPPDRAVSAPTNPPGTPRHGFSGECGKPESGCCTSTIGGPAPSSGPAALWAFGIGVVAWCSRSQRRARAKSRR